MIRLVSDNPNLSKVDDDGRPQRLLDPALVPLIDAIARLAARRDFAAAKQERVPPRRARQLNLPPHFVGQETNYRYRYPRHFPVPTPFGQVEVQYRVSRRSPIGYDREVGMKRDCFGWFQLGDRQIGAMQLTEYDFGLVDNEDIYEAMDSISIATERFGALLVESWRDLHIDVGGYGSILEFDGLWLHREFAQGSWWVAAAQQIISSFSYAAMMLNAFPLEYEARLDPETDNQDAFNFRRRAMMRLYQRTLGMQPFPGAAGEDGWMWAPNPKKAKYIEPPGFYPLFGD